MKDANVAFVCGGATSSESVDRPDLKLDQEDFISELVSRSRNVPIVAILMTPGAVVLPWANGVDGIVNLFLGGEATGLALADVVFGNVNPSGRLPLSFVMTSKTGPQPCESSGDCFYSEGLFVGYRGYNSFLDVRFPFGHGLSYSKFNYRLISNDEQNCPNVKSPLVICLLIEIENQSKRPGNEVAQLYLHFPPNVHEPDKVLKGFQKIFIPGGETRQLSFPLTERDISIWQQGQWNVVSGNFIAYLGSTLEHIHIAYDFSYDIATTKQKRKHKRWTGEN